MFIQTFTSSHFYVIFKITIGLKFNKDLYQSQ
jgi:hypothetical protein